MEVALVRFIGAGLALVFEGFEETVPVGAVANADQFLARAGAASGAVVIAAVERVTSEIWREWRIAKLPRALAKAHLEALPQLLDHYRVPRSQMVGAVSVARAAQRTGSQAPGHAARVASTIVGELKTAGVFKDGALNESIAYFFIDRLLTHLLKEPQLFPQLRDTFRGFIADAGWEHTDDTDDGDAEPTAAADDGSALRSMAGRFGVKALQPANGSQHPTPRAGREQTGDADSPAPRREEMPVEAAEPEHPAVKDVEIDAAALRAATATQVARLAPAYRVPEAALSVFANRVGAKGLDGLPARLDEVAVNLRNLLALMAEPAEDPHDTDTRSAGEEARAKLAEGDVEAADRLLANVETRLKRAAQGDFGGSDKLLTAAGEVSAQRGLLAELSFDWRSAAGHYGAAAGFLPAANRKGRWRFLMSKALVLERLGRDDGVTSALVNAANVYSDAVRLLSEQEDPADWAQTYLQLGQLLLLLGRRENRPERYLAAALHFKPALDVFSQLHDTDNWVRAHWGLADSLRAQGEVQGDVEILSEAAFAYRAVLGILTRERAPEDWAAVSFALGTTLLRLGQESGDVEALEDAATTLKSVIDCAEHTGGAVNFGEVLAKRGHVLLALGAARGELELIAEAAQLLQSAIEFERVPMPEVATAAALDALGSALLVLAEVDNDIDATLRAAEAKDAALTYYQSVGEEGLVESLTRELEEIVARLPEEETARESGTRG